MADRWAVSLGVVAILGVGVAYFALNSRLSQREEKDAAEDSARKQLLAEPSKFLRCESVKFGSDGKKGSGHRVTEATIKNTSAYAVADIRGNVEYRANGKVVATVPATVSGMLLGDGTAALSVTTTEVLGWADPKETAFVPTSVAIVAAR